jgi:CRP/FNR family transcriptional regulator, cyclic AMP receptor protein
MGRFAWHYRRLRHDILPEPMDPQALRACALFQSLPADRLRRIAEIATHRDLPAGAIIFAEAERGDEMYVVVAGKVRISKQVPGVGEEALGILEPGSHFGEMAMMDDSPRSADAVAHTACALAVVRRDDLDHLMFVDKDLAYDVLWAFVRTLSARLRETNDKIKGFFAMSGGF